jgi:hypothetical protein
MPHLDVSQLRWRTTILPSSTTQAYDLAQWNCYNSLKTYNKPFGSDDSSTYYIQRPGDSMVVFVDYERDSFDDVQHRQSGGILHPYTVKGGLSVVKTHDEGLSNNSHGLLNGADQDEKSSDSRDDLNLNAFSRCLACYPYALPLYTPAHPSIC